MILRNRTRYIECASKMETAGVSGLVSGCE